MDLLNFPHSRFWSLHPERESSPVRDGHWKPTLPLVDAHTDIIEHQNRPKTSTRTRPAQRTPRLDTWTSSRLTYSSVTPVTPCISGPSGPSCEVTRRLKKNGPIFAADKGHTKNHHLLPYLAQKLLLSLLTWTPSSHSSRRRHPLIKTLRRTSFATS